MSVDTAGTVILRAREIRRSWYMCVWRKCEIWLSNSRRKDECGSERKEVMEYGGGGSVAANSKRW